MKKLLLPVLLSSFLWSCDDSTTLPPENPNLDNQAPIEDTPPVINETPTPTPIDDETTPAVSTALTMETGTAVANGFCEYRKHFQIISSSFQAAYAPKGNGQQINTCGGENNYQDDGFNFSFDMNDYCVNARGYEVFLNGNITGHLDAGSNFFSVINGLSIVGDIIDVNITGDNTYYGRTDDNHMNLTIVDNDRDAEIKLDGLSIKKGEFDFGYATFPGLGRYYFLVIKHFNDTFTEGYLFLYGEGQQKVIISADPVEGQTEGMITAVYQVDKHDDGTWLDLPCNE